MTVTLPLAPETALSTVFTDPAGVPCYAARSLLQRFAARVPSVLFAVICIIARLRKAEEVLILDRLRIDIPLMVIGAW